MRILMTTDTVGGVWSFTGELTRQFLDRGHTVHLVSLGRRPSPDQEAFAHDLRARFPQQFGFTATDIPLEWMQNNERARTDGDILLQQFLHSSTAPDIILTSQFCFGHLQTTIPRIVVAHSDVLSWASACQPSALEPTPWLMRYTSLVQTGLLDAAALITPTDWMGKALVANFFLPRRYLVIPNGASVEEATDPVPERKLQAITAGRLWDQAKGLDSLSEVRVPMPLLVAGDNTLDASQNAKGDPATWPEHLEQLGSLSQTALQQRFRESAIYLCASRYEPFGLAPLEAALCGCAVVARDLPSLREVWADGALYFTDNLSLESLLRSLAEDPAKLGEAQSRSWHRATLFTSERMSDSYLHLFQTVLQQQAVPHVA